MKQFLILLAIIGTVWACGGGDKGNANSTASNTPKAKAIDGKKLYKINCSTCHGLYGDMGASGAFNLTTSELSIAERQIVIAKGRGVMTPFESILEPEEIEAVAKYTLELKQ